MIQTPQWQAKTFDLEEGHQKRGKGVSSLPVLPQQKVQDLINSKHIKAESPFEEVQLQPASLDLRLGSVAYRVPGSFLPSARESVYAKLGRLTMYGLDISESAILEKGAVYIIPLEESLNLPEHISAKASPKSSIGRLDVFTRLIGEEGVRFDTLPQGYKGKLYLEVVPLTFSIVVHRGDRLNQLRFVDHKANVPVINAPAQVEEQWLSVDLSGDEHGLIGYRARRHAPIVDLAQVGVHPLNEFWEPLYANDTSDLILSPEEFYILVSKEKVSVPPHYAADLVPYDVSVGELRIHYAGFFDPGFGFNAPGGGTPAVLEVRAHDVPALVEDGQPIGRLVFEPLTDATNSLYGQDLGSNYANQGLKLSKYFTGKA